MIGGLSWLLIRKQRSTERATSLTLFTPCMYRSGSTAFRIIGITLIISGMTIMMSGVFQAMNQSSKALVVSIVQSVTLVGSAALLALMGSVRLVWWSFTISEIVIFVLSSVFLFRIYRLALSEDEPLSHRLTERALTGNM